MQPFGSSHDNAVANLQRHLPPRPATTGEVVRSYFFSAEPSLRRIPYGHTPRLRPHRRAFPVQKQRDMLCSSWESPCTRK